LQRLQKFGIVAVVPAKHKFSSILPDARMRLLLEQGNTLVFEGLARNWQEVEKQVERLGFGEEYLVLSAKGTRGGLTKVIPASN
jgi:hypothetical protein